MGGLCLLVKLHREGSVCLQPAQQACFDVNREKYAKEIQYCVQDIQIGQGKNPRDVTLRQHTCKEAGSWPFFLFKFFLHSREFLQSQFDIA